MTQKLHSFKTWMFVFIFSVFLIITGLVITNIGEKAQNDSFVVLTYFVNIVLFNWQLINAVKERPFSLNLMFWFFSLFFFGYAPLLQFFVKSNFWGISPTVDELVRTNIYIFVWSVFYMFGRRFFKKPVRRELILSIRKKKPMLTDFVYSVNEDALIFMVVLSIASTLYFIATIGFSNMIFRSTNINEDLNTTQFLLSNHILKNIVVYTFALCLLHTKQTGKSGILFLVSAVCFLVSCFPTGIARNMMASFYGGIAIIFWDKTRQGRWFSFVIVASLIFLFPALDVFRNFDSFQRNDAWQLFLEELENTYITGDYDAHTMFVAIQRYVKKFDYSFGLQLVGAMFFFVPRSLWPSKPIGTGAMTAEKLLGNDFTNVSAPLVSEGYVNFGIIGVVLFAILLGFACRELDNKYWRTNEPLCSIKIIYPLCLFQFFFMLRGDLMSGGAYMIGRILVGWLICSIAISKTPKNAITPKSRYIK